MSTLDQPELKAALERSNLLAERWLTAAGCFDGAILQSDDCGGGPCFSIGFAGP